MVQGLIPFTVFRTIANVKTVCDAVHRGNRGPESLSIALYNLELTKDGLMRLEREHWAKQGVPMTDSGIPTRIWFVVRLVPTTGVVRVEQQFNDPSRGLADAQAYQREHGGYIIEALDWRFFASEKGID